MKVELRQLEQYLHDTLGIHVTAKPWPANLLPHFLRERYDFAQADMMTARCLFLIDTHAVEVPPAIIRKHLDLVRTRHDGEVIYVRPQVTAYNRKRLIEQKVPFIVPRNQLYLPMFAIDLREHFRKTRDEPLWFSPATQAVVIHTLLYDAKEDLIPLDLARRLGYSAMTLTRAFDELESAKFATTAMRGRKRCLRLPGTRQETWARAQPFLRNPVARRLFIDRRAPLEGPRAGLTALAERSMLSPPANATFAVSKKQWSAFRHRHKVEQMPEADPDSREVQVWNYAPALFVQRDAVDPLSLYLSLRDDRDERIQASLEEMMRELGW